MLRASAIDGEQIQPSIAKTLSKWPHWHRYVGDRGDVLGVDRFGASAPRQVVMNEYGFSVENVCKRAPALLERKDA